MSLIKCRVCKGTGYAALIADRGRPTSICGECGGSGTEETGCEECARLAREREAARAHFRRACEKLSKAVYDYDEQSADVWQVQIMAEVNTELAKQEKKQ